MRLKKIKVIIFYTLSLIKDIRALGCPLFCEILFTGESDSSDLLALPPGLTVFESGQKKPEKRKKLKGGDAEEIDNFLGPWAKYVDEKAVAKPSEVMT